MLSSLKFILKSQLKRQSDHPGGFTLIELLVALIMAALIITPVLGFMINFLQTDRREQAKTTTEQDIQSALDYMAQDMQQAVYIYNEEALTSINPDGIKGALDTALKCPNDADSCQPILVFWKRRFLAKDDVLSGTIVGTKTNENDTFVYSLVAYSLVDTEQNINNLWSPSARIVRYELRDALDFNQDGTDEIAPDPAGFQPFNLDGKGSLTLKMNQWNTPGGEQEGATLIDYIDEPDEPDSNAPVVNCKVGEQRIPDDSTVNSFVVCMNLLNPSIPTARVYLRGNALARIPILQNEDYDDKYSTFFPTSSILVRGNGFLFTQ